MHVGCWAQPLLLPRCHVFFLCACCGLHVQDTGRDLGQCRAPEETCTSRIGSARDSPWPIPVHTPDGLQRRNSRGSLHSGAVGCANASSTALRQLTDRDCLGRWTEGPRKEAVSCTEHNCHFPLTQPSLQDVWVLVVLCLFFFSCAAPAGTLGRLLGGAPALAPGLSRARTPGGTQGSPERRQIKTQGPRRSTRHTSIGYAYIFV